jgi:uncharacterized OB-fold protein
MRPLPSMDGPDAPFWQALRRREVRVQRCRQCGTHRFPASRTCANCRSDGSEWVAVAPRGVVETWCVFHRQYFEGLPVPYAVIQVKLDCGVRLFSNPAAGVGTGALRIGMAVEGVFDDVAPDVTLLKFAPERTRE